MNTKTNQAPQIQSVPVVKIYTKKLVIRLRSLSAAEFQKLCNPSGIPSQPDGTPCATATTCDVTDICDGGGCSLKAVQQS